MIHLRAIKIQKKKTNEMFIVFVVLRGVTKVSISLRNNSIQLL